MDITYDFPHVFRGGADRVENAQVLEAMLHMLARVNYIHLRRSARRGRFVPSLYESGVVYGRTRKWLPIPAMYKNTFADCKSLTAAIIAEMMMKDKECRPVFRWKPDGDSTDYHILVQLPRGRFEDPSKRLGMGADEVAKYTESAPSR